MVKKETNLHNIEFSVYKLSC